LLLLFTGLAFCFLHFSQHYAAAVEQQQRRSLRVTDDFSVVEKTKPLPSGLCVVW
jgi:hypothetical protein